MSDHCRARIVRVRVDKHGASLATAAAVGATSLSVRDAGDLPADGGSLLVDDDTAATLDYTAVTFVEDADASDLTTADTITLSAPLATAIDAGTSVFLWDDDEVVADYIAVCIPEDDEDEAETGDPIRATIPPHLQDDLPTGKQPGLGVRAVLEYDDDADEWTVKRMRGSARGPRWEDDDPHVITTAEVAAGVVTHTLKHGNVIERSMQVTWGRVQPPTCYSVDTTNGVLTYTLDGKERADDVLDIQYQYRPGLARTTSSFLLNWGSAGWRSLEVAASDSTNRSGTGFDDSSWAVASAPFGDDLGHPFDYIPGLNWPAPVTSIPKLGAVWLRRTITGVTGALAVSVRVDNDAKVYWNGVLIGTTADTSVGEYTFSVASGSVLASNVLAVRGEDAGPANSYNHTYLDVKVASS